jgi:hypothetical protein
MLYTYTTIYHTVHLYYVLLLYILYYSYYIVVL